MPRILIAPSVTAWHIVPIAVRTLVLFAMTGGHNALFPVNLGKHTLIPVKASQFTAYPAVRPRRTITGTRTFVGYRWGRGEHYVEATRALG